MNDTAILLEFLKMPLGSSDEVFEKFTTIPEVIHRGSEIERFLYARGKRANKVLLVAHADTYWDQHYSKKSNQPFVLSDINGIIRNVNGGLGADDRAGCAILWLLKDMGHSILITDGEEGGKCGSNWLMNENQDIADEINNNHQFVIQLDRKNGKDFKCYSVGTDEFRKYVIQVTGYSEPDRDASTDIVTLCRRITGVNLSIGYRNEHSEDEKLILHEWQHTLNVCRKWLHEDELPNFNF